MKRNDEKSVLTPLTDTVDVTPLMVIGLFIGLIAGCSQGDSKKDQVPLVSQYRQYEDYQCLVTNFVYNLEGWEAGVDYKVCFFREDDDLLEFAILHRSYVERMGEDEGGLDNSGIFGVLINRNTKEVSACAYQ